MTDVKELLEIAKKAALKSGDYLKKNFLNDTEILLNKGRDIKLKIDKESEKIILGELLKKTNYPVLSEESGASSELNDTYWIVDPLDGSSNYQRKIPICATSIALMYKNEIVLGVTNDFLNGNLYFASKNNGAYCNNKQIRVSNIESESMATLITGIPAKEIYSNKEFEDLVSDFQAWKKIRMIGSAAIANVYVASGLVDMYKENDIFLWDIAAGSILVSEAGGKSLISDIKEDFRVMATYTNGQI